ncbi:MAG: preprotein translocase subunit SecG [Pseudomonadota bacterium]
MENIVLTVHLLLALALILTVLLQRSEGGGLGIGGGGGGGGDMMSSRGAATALSKLTWGLAVGFLITSLTLTILATQNSQGASVVGDVTSDGLPDLGGGLTLPPSLQGDLTPPSAADSPALPPAAD